MFFIVFPLFYNGEQGEHSQAGRFQISDSRCGTHGSLLSCSYNEFCIIMIIHKSEVSSDFLII